jgi:hypothetical protein
MPAETGPAIASAEIIVGTSRIFISFPPRFRVDD